MKYSMEYHQYHPHDHQYSVEAGLRPFKDSRGNEGSLGSSLGQALALSSKASTESQSGL